MNILIRAVNALPIPRLLAGVLFWLFVLQTHYAQGGQTVYSNGSTLTHKTSDGKAVVVFPDVCKTPSPGGPVPIPYPNIARASDTSKGDKKVQSGEKPILKKKSTFEKSPKATVKPKVTVKTKGKVFYGTYSFDVKFPGAVAPKKDKAASTDVSPAVTEPPISQVPVLQAEDGETFVLCGDTLYPANLFSIFPTCIQFVDPPPFEGPIFPYKSGHVPTEEEQAAFQADWKWRTAEELRRAAEAGQRDDEAFEIILEGTEEQRALAYGKVHQYISDNTEYAGHRVQAPQVFLGQDGLYEGEIIVAYGNTAVRSYIARFDTQGNLIEKPTLTPQGRAEQTGLAHTPPGSEATWEERTDVDGNIYIAKVKYTNGGGYWMFNEKGQSYFGQTFDPETGSKGFIYETRNYPVLSDRGEPLLEQSFTQRAQTRSPDVCQEKVDTYNGIADEINVIIREMNAHASEHTFDNEKAQAEEAGYDEFLRAKDYDPRTGPEPAKPASTSLKQNNRARYEELQLMLDELKPGLLEAKADLQGCGCQEVPPDPLSSVLLWGDPYVAEAPAGAGCLSAAIDALSTGAGIPASCANSALQSWYTHDCGSGCGDVAVASSADRKTACSGEGYPIGLDWFGYPVSACDVDKLGPDDFELGVSRASLQNVTDPAWSSTGSMRPDLADQWGLRRILKTAGGAFASLPEEAESTLVAVIDSGLDQQHPELLGQVWINPRELPGNDVDDDGNGLVDDVNGWNFISDSNDTRDTNGHGTLVAGIIGARRDNGIGIAGTNPWARLMPLKVTNFRGEGNSVDLAAAITYAAHAGARVINISLGGATFSKAERDAVTLASEKGALLIVAAGNSGVDVANFWPAGLNNVITVAATEPNDSRSPYSNWGGEVDIAAPGSDILSLRAAYTDPLALVGKDYQPRSHVLGESGQYYYTSGTSFAAPHVAGIASLLFSLHPQLTAMQVRNMILNSAHDIEAQGIDPLSGYGRLDGAAALVANPDFYIRASISQVSTAKVDGEVVVIFSGDATADSFQSATIELGRGEDPKDWVRVGKTINTPISGAALASVPATKLRQASHWTIRLRIQHKNGRTRETRFPLSLQ